MIWVFDWFDIIMSENWLEFVQEGIPSLESLYLDRFEVDEIDMSNEISTHINLAFPNIERLEFDSRQISAQWFGGPPRVINPWHVTSARH